MATTKAKTAPAKAAGKKEDKAPAKKAPAFTREMDMKFGIDDLAKALDLDATYTRAKLRNHGVEKKAKGGTAYGWNSREDLDKVVKLLSSGAKAKDAKPANKNDKAKDDGKKKAASAQKTPAGMPAGKDKGKPVTKLDPKTTAPKDGAIKKVAKDVAAGKKALKK